MLDRMTKGGCGCDSQAPEPGLMSVDEARAHALAQVAPLAEFETLAVSEAAGRVCAETIRAEHAMPRFDNSAMDGFALRSADLAGRCCLPVAGEVAAGDAACVLPEGTALRIFTGAPLPEGADAVAMVETCIDKGHKVHFNTKPQPGDNIRRAGGDQAAGAALVREGSNLAPRHVGLLAANGITRLRVSRRPRVAVFSTGAELAEGAPGPGQVTDANRPLLLALLRAAGAEPSDLGILPDDLDATAAALGALEGRFDLVLTSGAVSMGGRDHVRAALAAAGGDVTGWRVALKPGKPVLFGRLGRAAFTGLPGNPFAVHVGFHLFVAAQVARLAGAAPAPFAPVPARAAFDWARKPGRAEVFPVHLAGHDAAGVARLERLGASVSATLYPLAEAHGLAMVPPECDRVSPGDVLRWQPFCGALN